MILTHLNYLAVAVSAVVYFAIGAVYFNPKVFGTTWMQGHALSPPNEEDKKGMGKLMTITFIYCLISCVGIGCLVQIIRPGNWMVGVKIGLLAGMFASVGIAVSHMYTRKSLTLAIIDSGYHLLGSIAAGVIQTMWL
ncbi:MAG: DUF1761 domain-containing protein [Cyclobacteriaceae bacterium]